MARAIRTLVSDARKKIEKRDHPALILCDLADIAAYASDIERVMTEARIGIE